MYCSLEEAWGNNSISKFYDDNKIKQLKNDRVIEHFTDESINNMDGITISDCDEKINKIFKHISKCEKCQKKLYKKLKKKFGSSENLTDKLKEIINNNNEIIVVILLGICILVFLNLVKSLISSNK